MKILMVCGSLTRAGVSRVVSLLSQEWEKEHEVSIFVFKESLNDTCFTLGGNIVQSKIMMAGCFWSQIFHLYWHLQHHQYDLIYGFSEEANQPLILAAKWAKLAHKVILSVHILPERFSSKTKRRVSRYYPLAHTVIAVSQGVRKSLLSLGLPDDKVKFIANPIDFHSIVKLAQEQSSIQLNPQQQWIVAMGRLHKHKGFDLLIEAFAQINKLLPSARLCIIGEGAERQSLTQSIENLGLQDKVVLTGEQINPFPILAQASLFVLSSRQESWGLALVEAMALGLPVLAADCPYGATEILDKGKLGKLTPCENVQALSDAITQKLTPITDEMITPASVIARAQSFDIPVIAQQWLNAISQR